MSEFLKRTWAEIDLSAIERNYRAIRGTLRDGCRMMAVVKADAYGHGDTRVAQLLQGAGADWFGVSNLEEAVRLRDAGITRPILILSYTPPEEAVNLAKYDITQTVISEEYAVRLNAAAADADVRVAVHIKVDTGMGRVGFFCRAETVDAVCDEIARVCELDRLDAEGIFTHFACADEEDGEAFTRRQFALFSQTVATLEARGVTFSIKHCCNSAATIRFPEMQWDMVRPGIILYGLHPSSWMRPMLPLEPAMSLRSVLSQVKSVPRDTSVSYGRTHTLAQDSVVATVPIGYADGYPRALSNTARMLLGGYSVPLIGRVCMDQCLLDVTAVPNASDGMTVTVFGKDGDAVLPVEELSAIGGSIHYETVCLIGKRVPRIFYRDGNAVGTQNYLISNK